jgi:hypothetical protein
MIGAFGAWAARMRANVPTHNSGYGNPTSKNGISRPVPFLG